MRVTIVTRTLLLVSVLALIPINQAGADELYGRIRGVVTDPSGAVVAGVEVTVSNLATGLSRKLVTNADGTYEFQNLPVGTYSLSAQKENFKVARTTNITLSLNQIYVRNIRLELGEVTQQVEVQANPVQVEATSMELGTVISGQTIVDMPLNGRDWIQLQQLQPGVVSQSDRFNDAYATNGSQSQQNSFLINGTDSNDLPLNTPLVIPSPDAIGEFRLVTNTINPEYGRNSGAVLNAVIKSGTNAFHGSAFEFYRDTGLNATRWFLQHPDVLHRNQFGGTIGGPIWKNHTFFFFSYQGTRESRAEDVNDSGADVNGLAQVYTAAERQGDFSEGVSGCPFGSNTSPFPLKDSTGATQPAGTAYCTLWPTGQIPISNFNPVSQSLMTKYVPLPNQGVRDFSFNPVHQDSEDQELFRIDHTISAKDTVWFYGLFDRNPTTDVLPFIGASLPGFGQTSQSHTQQYTAAWNHTFGFNALNELRLGYTRLNFVAVEPAQSVQPASVGFTGITPQNRQAAGVPTLNVSGLFTLGFSDDGPQPRKDDTYQLTDNFGKVVGRHSLKFGFEGRRFGVGNPFFFLNNGHFDFAGSGGFSTGVPGADFLLGIPDDYIQSSGNVINARAYEYYSYAQDQFSLRPNLTLTYGVGWQVDTPLTDLTNHSRAINCFRPGQQSKVYPTAPAGLVFPGDANCTSSGYSTHPAHFGPRFGFAWSPDLGRLSGGPGKLSIRGGYGIYFNRSEEEVTLQNLIAPPFALIDFGVTDVGGAPSLVAPFTDITGSQSIPNKYPFVAPAAGSNVDFSFFEPLSLNTLDPHFTIPYSENYNLTVERELPARTILSVAYVGAVAHHLLSAFERNPGINPQGCAADANCVQNRNIQNILFPGNFLYPGNIFGSVGQQSTVGNSNYNALQLTANKHTSHGLQFLAAYTYSHSLDLGSSFENASFGPRGTNPFNPKLDYGDSAFDARQRLVVSYSYSFPDMHGGNAFLRHLASGWRISGITTLQSGFPVTIADNHGFRSLTCTVFSFYACPDVPNVLGPVQTFNPRNTSFTNNTQGSGTSQPNYYFNPNDFAVEAFGTFGNARRNFFHGPGLNVTDFAIFKDTQVTETTRVELRLEMFNVANHANFLGNNTVPDGNINNGTFGRILAAQPPRLVQLAAKFYF
jgi:hypothetical protein